MQLACFYDGRRFTILTLKRERKFETTSSRLVHLFLQKHKNIARIQIP